MSKLIQDLSSLTMIPTKVLSKLADISVDCIGHSVYEAIFSKESLVKVDIGIGMLYIRYDDNDIRYKFIPSKELEEVVDSTVSTMSSPIAKDLETTLRKRIESTYKDLL